MSSVEQAVTLLRQAVTQDSKRNYTEAARCYREAIAVFRELRKSRNAPRRLQDLIASKLSQYEQRLKIIDRHLLSQADLTKLFKDLEGGHLSDCGSRGSLLSDTGQRHGQSLLLKSLELLRRGRREDEAGRYSAALQCYEPGLASLLDLVHHAGLAPAQAEAARAKCLLYLDRAELLRSRLEGGAAVPSRLAKECGGADSPLPTTPTEEALEMEEVRSECGSRLQSRGSDSLGSSTLSLDTAGSHCPPASKRGTSLHSLYPACEIRKAQSSLSVRSGVVERSPPLASLVREFSLSEQSVLSVQSNADKILVMDESVDDEEEEELKHLKDNCDDAKSEGSDSGYSDPSPDGTIRDSKSPGSDSIMDRKSPFSESDGSEVGELIPKVIVVNESSEQRPVSPRPLFDRQRSRFQNPGQDILISQLSRDNLAVFDSLDSSASVRPAPRHEVTFAARPEVYGPGRGHEHEQIPRRATAAQPRGEHEDMNVGCYYLMSALDFCWCL